jgi:MFS family permease
MAGRLIFGHLPDKIGGARVALVCVLIEAVGQALTWLAPSSTMALIGASVTGLGYSLVYPGFGVEAVRHAPPQSRGLAMGAYTAFLDLALGLANLCWVWSQGGCFVPGALEPFRAHRKSPELIHQMAPSARTIFMGDLAKPRWFIY